MWGVRLFGSANAEPVYSCKPWEVYKAPLGTEELLVIEDYVTAFSVFKHVTRSGAGTTIIATPKAGGSLSVTDVVVSATKIQSATTTLQFNDDSQQEVVFTITTTNQPANLTIPVKGRMQGWKDARLELVTVNAVVAHLTVGYMRLPAALEYSEWNNLRG